MLQDCQAQLLVVTPDQTDIPEFTGKVITISLAEIERNGTPSSPAHPAPASPHEQTERSQRPAYMMYTSGSTGTPKGVVTTHRNVVKTVINNGYMNLLPTDRMLQLSNYAFDGSTYEIFGALLKRSYTRPHFTR